jgi:photosynthetic reaction center cytochrome c subunit
MKLGWRRTIVGAMGTAVVCLLCVALVSGQAGPEQKPLMSEQAFKNVQVLRGIPVKEFMETMGFFSASLNANCTTCHVEESSGSWDRYADDIPIKQTARRMVLMMRAINQSYFGGRRLLTCYSCHRNGDRPKVTPSLAEIYGTPPPEEPDEILEQAPGVPSADQILDKYIQALGGAQRLASLTSFVAKGTYQGYDTEKSPVEIFAKAPGQRAVIVHSLGGDSTTTYDGRFGWAAAPETDTPVPVLDLTAGDLDGAKVDAELSFPGRIKQILSKWRVGFPATIDDRDVQVVQGSTAGGFTVKLYFDPKTNLLVRQVRYNNSPVGLIPTQVDYSDYREVAGVKMPFHVNVEWLDGRSTTELASVQPNVPVDAAKFAKPAPPTPSKSATR